MTIIVVNKIGMGPFTSRDMYVGRPGPLGNPFIPKIKGVGETLEQYAHWLLDKCVDEDPVILNRLGAIRKASETGEVRLVCWCAPNPCHADIIKQAVEEGWDL